MALAMMNVRIDKADKLAFEEFCRNTGMNISVAINMFVKNVIRRQSLPFAVEADPFYSHQNQVQLKKAIDQLNRGEGTEHELIEV